MNFISDARLAMLQFMADNNGITPMRAEQMEKAGKRAAEMPHATTIAVTTTELKLLLEAYREKTDGRPNS